MRRRKEADKTVLKLIKEYNSGTSPKRLAAKYDISQGTVHNWVNRFNTKSLVMGKAPKTKCDNFVDQDIKKNLERIMKSLNKGIQKFDDVLKHIK